ncbi:tetraspanin, partial [Metarhizium majus ARSEF 297]
MASKVFTTTLGISLLFLASGCLELGFSLVVRNMMDSRPESGQEAVRNLLYQMFPLTAGIANGAATLATFAFTLLGLMSPMRSWLKAGGYLITLCGLFTLCLGVYLWIMTLRLKDGFFPTYLELEPGVQSLVQQSVRAGVPPSFFDFVRALMLALLRGCGTAISSFSNTFIDNIFTALFGIVGLDAILILSIASLLKERKERERYRHIDEKSGFRQF